MKKVLIAGATGYLGQYAVPAYKMHGYWVRALARNPQKLDTVKEYIDDLFVAEATQSDTLAGICEGVDVVFSSLGITRQTDKVTYWDVDYQANKNILDEAIRSGVKKFVFITAINPQVTPHLEMIQARERFIEDLKASGLDYSVVRATGFFSDMSEILKMAKSGWVFLLGSGHNKTNPIHGADLAQACISATEGQAKEVEVGGPDIFSYEQVAYLAFAALNRKPKIVRLPVWLVKLVGQVIRPFNNHMYNILGFMTAVFTHDMVANSTGNHTLSDYFQSEAAK